MFGRPQRLKASAVLVVLFASLLCEPALAKVRALVVGVDRYQHLPSLAGAVNDAQDIAAVLAKIPDSEVQVLLDDEVTYAAVREAWFSVLGRATAGDAIVFSYAGHGSRVPELVAGSESDGQDDVFVLGGYANTALGRRQMIRDNELYDWFSAAQDKGVQLLFIADSCHSGTMTRAADQRVRAPRTRQVDIDFALGLESELRVEIESPDKQIERTDLPFLTFISAGLESQQIPELMIKSLSGANNTRGALSYVVARALEGEADSDSDGLLTREELRHYVLENVSVLSERQQTPSLSPQAVPEQTILAIGPGAPPLVTASVDRIHAVYSADLNAADRAYLAEKIPDLRWEIELDRADLLLDAHRGELLSAAGDVLVSGLAVSAKSELVARLRGALDKRTTLHTLKALARRTMLKTKLAPDSRAHALGERIEPTFYGQHGEYLAVLNIAGDGTIQWVYPWAKEGDMSRHGLRPWTVPLRVAQPLGEDHLIALSFAEARTDLVKALKSLHGTRDPLRMLALIKPTLIRAGTEVGVVAMFSQAPPH